MPVELYFIDNSFSVGVFAVPFDVCLFLSHVCLNRPLPPQVKTEMGGVGGEKVEAVSECQTDGQHPQTPPLALHHPLCHAPLSALAANPNPLRPAPATRPPNRPWIWTS